MIDLRTIQTIHLMSYDSWNIHHLLHLTYLKSVIKLKTMFWKNVDVVYTDWKNEWWK